MIRCHSESSTFLRQDMAADAGVVDQDIDRADLIAGALDEAVDDAFFGDVADPAGGTDAVGGEAAHGRRQFGLADIDDDDRGTGGTEMMGAFEADAGSAAGDQRDPAGEIEEWRLSAMFA